MPVWLDHLKKRYVAPDGAAVPVIDIDEFRLGDGEHVALVGGSGTGKTTLLHLIAGILAPDSGRILFGSDAAPPASGVLSYQPARAGAANAVDIAALSEAQRDQFRGRYMGYIFQTH